MATEPRPSRIVTGTEIPDFDGAPVLTVHGDPDDHLRLTVLLAQTFGSSAESGHLREAVQMCATPTKVTWAQRLDALTYILEHAPPPEGRRYGAVIVDPDALDVGQLEPHELWDDRDFRRQRAELLQVVIDAVADGGWLVVRPNPSSAAMRKLDGVAKFGFLETESAAPAPEMETALGSLQNQIAPECRPILSWIVRSGKLPEREVQRRFDAGGADGFQDDVLGVAYEVIPSHAREAAKRVAALRGFQPKNGMLGPFHLFDEAGAGEVELAIDAARRLGAPNNLEARGVAILEQCGFLQPGPVRDGHPTLRMPRAVRGRLLPLAKLGDPDLLERQHQVLGAGAFDELSIDEQLETHFHAVQGGKLADALRTARFYATDLRALALRFSHEKRYSEAAEVYRRIVQEFDPEDAYAWEHLGVNLVLASGGGPLLEEYATGIRNAYSKAFEYDPHNPLYHGRLLGFRAQLGEDVHAEVQRGLKRYLIRYGDQSRAINYFTEPVREAMNVRMFGSFRFLNFYLTPPLRATASEPLTDDAFVLPHRIAMTYG